MSLANLIALVSSVNADPTTAPEVNVEPEIVETVIGRNMPKAERASKKQAKAAPIHNANEGKSMTPGITMPERNTLDAKGFLLAMRNAGKRPNDKGVMVVHPNEVRNDQIKAIHAFVGYDNRRDFGSQDTEARAKAQRDLRGYQPVGPSREEERAASRTLQGFVAGMPQPSQKLLANLRAREQSIAEAMIDAKTEEERSAAKVALAQVRQAIDELVG